MSGPLPPRRYSERTLRTAGTFAWDAVSALGFITDPERWPAFVAWAEQLGPGEPWDADDYTRMCLAAQYFLEVAKVAEHMQGGPANGADT